MQKTFRRKLWEVAAVKGEHEVLPTNSDYKSIGWKILWVNLLDWLSDWLLEFIAVNSEFCFFLVDKCLAVLALLSDQVID